MALVAGANLQRPVFLKEPTIAPAGTWKREDEAEAYMTPSLNPVSTETWQVVALMRPSALHRLTC